MALSGTTLTVTTLTTTGILTNNTSGQVSTVTGSSLGSLLGGSPTFTGLTLSGLGSGVLKTTAGVVGNAVAGTDYQYPVSPGTNISITGANTNVINVISSPVFTGLTISGLATGVLKVTSGLVSLATAYTDYTPALTASGNITINTGTGVIDTVASPTFARIFCSSIGTNNTLSGTSAGASLLTSGLGGNTLSGYQAGVSITSGLTNTCYGYNAGGVLATGSNGLYIGNGSTASSSGVSNEGVINVSGSTATGRGANTLFINANAGLYGYSPAYCMLYSTAFNAGIVTWAFYSDGTTTYNKGFTLYNSNTLVVQPINAIYKITFSGTAVCNNNTASINLTVTNIVTYVVALNSGSGISGYAVSINGATLSRPYAAAGGTASGWSVSMGGCYYWQASAPIFMIIEYYSL